MMGQPGNKKASGSFLKKRTKKFLFFWFNSSAACRAQPLDKEHLYN